MALLTWTGVAAICFFSCRHLQDTIKPNWICTVNMLKFSHNVLDKDMWDVTRLFKQWCCTKGRSTHVFKPPKKILTSFIAVCNKVGGRVISMNFRTYERKIFCKPYLKNYSTVLHNFGLIVQ